MADTFTQPFTHHTGSKDPGVARLRHQRPCVEPTPPTHIRPAQHNYRADEAPYFHRVLAYQRGTTYIPVSHPVTPATLLSILCQYTFGFSPSHT